ncbi:MAG: lipopolysaccharide biosynthesis protein [Bacteroidia bacterium]|nr:lipopolysaccharide biosynthesis protein [Bacteroidia bacterium]
MKYSPRNILKSELIRNTSVLITGTVIAQLISILLQPFLRRFFSAEAFGTFAVYMSMVGIAAVVSTFRYDDAIVLPRNDKESANLVALSLLFNFAISLFFLIVIILLKGRIIRFLNLPSTFPASLLYLIPLSVFLINTYQSLNYWLIRKKKYFSVSLNKMIRRGTEAVAQVLFALFKNPKGLIFSDIIGQIANVTAIAVQGLKSGFNFKLVSVTKLKYVYRKYSDFPKYNLIPAFMNSCSFYLPPVLINKFYSAEFTGYFDLSKLVLSIPVAFVATAISNVLLQQISEKYNSRKSILHDLKPIFFIVILISIAVVLVISFFGVDLFKFIFGNEWELSGKISRIMVWSFALSFLVSSFSCLFFSMRKIKTYSVWQCLYLIAILCLLLFRNIEFVEFVKIYVIIEVICYTALTCLLVYIVSQYEYSLKRGKI